MRRTWRHTATRVGAGAAMVLGAILVTAQRAAAQDSAATTAPTVLHAAVANNVADRMPVDTAESFSPDVGKLFAWVQIQDAAGSTIHHVWYHGETKTADVSLHVSTSPWRGWSTKLIQPSDTGAWHVDVTDASGKVLATLHFTIGS
ncbi:MAG TPA: DUF2914 domain-containing protein [Gemmatimonadales bacterium]|nr:DUF2914 domain-containing protein [Gemmatimonadales bacterium]